MTTPPPVSVLLPVRNGASFLAEALGSLSAQTFPDFEVVAVDDGSSDDTAEILREWARLDPRLRVLRQSARGIVGALERGRREARGALVARMDADDVAEPRRLERQVAAMEADPTLAVCGAHVAAFPPECVRDGGRRYEAWLNGMAGAPDVERNLFVECPLAHPTFVLRADAVEAVGGYRDRGWPEDYDLLLRLWRGGGRLGTVPELLLRWRFHPESLSRTGPAYAAEAFRRCKVHHLQRTLLAGRPGAVVWGAGPVGKTFARSLLAAGVPVLAFVDVDPRKIGQAIHGARVVRPEDVDAFRGALCLSAVGQVGAREEIRAALTGAGWTEMRDFVAVA